MGGKKHPFKNKKSKKRKRQGIGGDEGGVYDEDDEDFFASSHERRKAHASKRKEFYSRRDEGEYLDDLDERNKVFKDNSKGLKSLLEKVTESDIVCATRSLLVCINCDHDAIYYQGDPTLVSKF